MACGCQRRLSQVLFKFKCFQVETFPCMDTSRDVSMHGDVTQPKSTYLVRALVLSTACLTVVASRNACIDILTPQRALLVSRIATTTTSCSWLIPPFRLGVPTIPPLREPLHFCASMGTHCHGSGDKNIRTPTVVTFRNVCINIPKHTGSNSVFHRDDRVTPHRLYYGFW